MSIAIRSDIKEEELMAMFETTSDSGDSLSAGVTPHTEGWNYVKHSEDEFFEIFGVLTIGFADSGVGIEEVCNYLFISTISTF